MAKKIFTFQGRTSEELKAMNPEDFLALLNARQRRSFKRGLTKDQKKFIKKVREWDGVKPLRTHFRSLIITPEFIDKRIAIHNGKEWNIVDIKAEMLGHYLGEFALTRKRVMHSGPGIGATRGTKFTSIK